MSKGLSLYFCQVSPHSSFNEIIYIRAVKVNALIYEIIVAEINAIKYFNAVNATLFTSGVFPLTRNRCVPAVSKLGDEDGES